MVDASDAPENAGGEIVHRVVFPVPRYARWAVVLALPLAGLSLLFAAGVLTLPLIVAVKSLATLKIALAVAVLLALAVGFAAGAWLLLWANRRLDPRPVTFGEHALYLHRADGGARTVAYTDLTALFVDARRRHARLHIEAVEVEASFPVRYLEPPEALADALAWVRERVRARDVHLAQRMEERNARGCAAFKRTPYATRTALVMLFLAYLAQLAVFDGDALFWLIRAGGNAQALVERGQVFRLFTAGLLHFGLSHLAMNLLAVAALGPILERSVGTSRWVLIYLASATVGAIGSWFLDRAVVAVGASVAVFGLLGAMVYLDGVHRARLPPGVRARRGQLLLLLALNAVVPFLTPAVDWAGHLGGLLVGVLVALMLCRYTNAVDPRVPAPMSVRLLTGVACFVTLVFVARGVIYASTPHPADETRVALALADKKDAEPGVQDAVLTRLLKAPYASPNRPNVSVRLARALLDAGEPTRDTRERIALALGYAGHFKRATYQASILVADHNDDRAFSLSGKLLAAHWLFHGRLVRAVEADALRMTARLDGDVPVLELELSESGRQGVRAWALLYDGGRLQGVLLVDLGPTQAESVRCVSTDKWRFEKAPAALEVEVAAVFGGTNADLGDNVCRWWHRPMDPEVDALPAYRPAFLGQSTNVSP